MGFPLYSPLPVRDPGGAGDGIQKKSNFDCNIEDRMSSPWPLRRVRVLVLYRIATRTRTVLLITSTVLVHHQHHVGYLR